MQKPRERLTSMIWQINRYLKGRTYILVKQTPDSAVLLSGCISPENTRPPFRCRLPKTYNTNRTLFLDQRWFSKKKVCTILTLQAWRTWLQSRHCETIYSDLKHDWRDLSLTVNKICHSWTARNKSYYVCNRKRPPNEPMPSRSCICENDKSMDKINCWIQTTRVMGHWEQSHESELFHVSKQWHLFWPQEPLRPRRVLTRRNKMRKKNENFGRRMTNSDGSRLWLGQ